MSLYDIVNLIAIYYKYTLNQSIQSTHQRIYKENNMPRLPISGIEIEYQLLGDSSAPAIAITPGGRFSKDVPGVRELGESLASQGKQVLLWDRPNCGASDVCFSKEGEGRLHARILCDLIERLGLGQTSLVGGSAGARVSLLAAIHRQDLFSNLAIWWVSGGYASLMMMGSAYCSEPAQAASTGGMEAVANLPMFAEQIRRNPRNRQIILNEDPESFIATMDKWAAGFIPSEQHAVPSLMENELNNLKIPILLFNNHPRDFFHSKPITDWLCRALPNVTSSDLPWPDDIFAVRMKEAYESGTGVGHFIDWPDLAPKILGFINQEYK